MILLRKRSETNRKILSIFSLPVIATLSVYSHIGFQSCKHNGIRWRIHLHLSWSAHCSGMLSGQYVGDLGRVEKWSPEQTHFLLDCVSGGGWFPGWGGGNSSGCDCGHPHQDPFPCLSLHELFSHCAAASVSAHPPGYCCGPMSASLYPFQVSRPLEGFEMTWAMGFNACQVCWKQKWNI